MTPYSADRPQFDAGAAIALARPPLTMARVIATMRLHWKLLLAVAFLITALVVVVTLQLKPLWSATATIQIEPNRRAQSEAPAVAQGVPPDQAIVDTQVALMTSPDVLAKVVRRLNLQSDPRFARATLAEPDRINAAVAALGSRVRAERQGSTYLVGLSARSEDPVEAARFANEIAKSYLGQSLRGRAETALEQSQTLRRQLDELGGEVREAEARVAAYRGARGIVENRNSATVTDQQIEPLAGALATAEAEAATAQARLAAARGQIAGGNIQGVSNVLDSPVITDLRRQRAEVVLKKSENDAVYGPTNPSTIALNQQLAALDQQIRAEANRVVSGLAATSAAASSSAARQRAQLSALRTEQAGNARASVSAESLERDAEAKRTVYNQLAQTAQEAAQRRQAATSVGSIVDRALPPTAPSFPNKPLFAALGLMLGLLAGTAAVVGVEFFDQGIKTPDDLEHVTGMGFVASVPKLSWRMLAAAMNNGDATPWDYLLARPMSTYAESLRDIRSALQLSPGDGAIKVVAIVSALPGDGKTSLAASLARIMALSGDRTLLIDADLRRNGLAELLPSAPQAGLLEVLAGKAKLDDALLADEPTGLHLLSLTGASFVSHDSFAGDAMPALLDQCRERYDYVVIDTPPLLAVADSRKIAAMADASVMAVRWSGTSRFAVQAAVQRQVRDGTAPWGAVFTMVDTGSAAVGRTDPAHYVREYKTYRD